MKEVEAGGPYVTRGIKGIRIEIPREGERILVLEYKGSGSECEIQFHSGWTAVYSLKGDLRRCTFCLNQYLASEPGSVDRMLGVEIGRFSRRLKSEDAEAMVVVNVAARRGALYAVDAENMANREERWTITFKDWLMKAKEDDIRTGLLRVDKFVFHLELDEEMLILTIATESGELELGIPLFLDLSLFEGSLEPEKIRERLLAIIKPGW